MAEIDNFEMFLRQENMSENTVSAYCFAVTDFFNRKKELTKKNLLMYKTYLMETFKPKTVNLRIQGINKYLEYTMEWYFVVRYLAATGARVSELIQIKIEHVKVGYIDIYGKGGKYRRIFIPKKLREETNTWLNQNVRTEGYLFLNRYEERITARGISQQLKNYAEKYGLNTKVVYPHSFRHRFAKNFLEKYNDIALLADLMGHESIETTRIYLRKSSMEQQFIVDKVVTW